MVSLPGRVEQGRLDVVRFHAPVVREDFRVRVAERQQFEHVGHAQARAADARAPAAFAGLGGDAIQEVHGAKLARRGLGRMPKPGSRRDR